jgi:hypothetical protein
MEQRQAEIAADIERQITELAAVARSAGLHTCAYRLEIAMAEAEEVRRNAGAHPSRPSFK